MLKVKIVKKISIGASLFAALVMLHGSHALAMQSQKQVKTIEELRQAARPAAQERFDRRNVLVFDGTDGANQCHINALMVVRLIQDGKKFIDLKNDQQRFLLDNFIRGILLRLDTNNGPKRAERLLGVKLSGALMKALRSSQSTIAKNIATQLIEDKADFFNASHQPMLWSDFAFRDAKINMFILPKFFGIKFLLEQANAAGIWMVIKCKTTCGVAQQVNTFLVAPDQMQMFHVLQGSANDIFTTLGLDPRQPVMVIEGHATIDSLTNGFAQHCNLLSGLNPGTLQRAIAAAWMKKNQPMACANLPIVLAEEHAAWLQEAERLGVFTENNETFFVMHMFPDTMANACSRDRLLSPEQNEQITEGEIEQLVWNV